MKSFGDTRLGKAWAAMTAALLETEVKAEGDVPAMPPLLPPTVAQAPAQPPAPPQPPAQPAAPSATDQPKTIGEDVKAMLGELADAYCEVLSTKGLALPNALAQIKQDFIRAATDDRLMPVAQGETPRLTALKARIEGVESHKLTTERVPDPAATDPARVLSPKSVSREEEVDKAVEEQERRIAMREAERVKAQQAANAAHH